MIDLLRPELRRMAAARIALAPARLGRVVSCDGGLIEVSGLPSPIGTLCRIEDSAGALSTSAEVIGFRAGHSLMMLLGDAVMLHPGACVRAEGEPGMVRVGEALLGRADGRFDETLHGEAGIGLMHGEQALRQARCRAGAETDMELLGRGSEIRMDREERDVVFGAPFERRFHEEVE